MKDDEDRLRDKLKSWKIETPSDAMIDQVVRRAVALPQYKPWWQTLPLAMESLFSDWQYGLRYKVTGLAVCAIFGLLSGLQQPVGGGLDVTLLAFSSAEGRGSL